MTRNHADIKLVLASGKRQLQATIDIPDISGETICSKLVGNVIYFEEVLSEILPNYCEVLKGKSSLHPCTVQEQITNL